MYSLTGAPRTNTLRLIGTETAATSTVAWVGAAMVVHTTSHPSDADLIQTDTWSLASDGRELTMKREAMYAGNSMGSPTLVFRRKP